jgi:hypothetical protein
MSIQWTVTRQCQWATGDNVVEISVGGLDYANPDALCQKYPGEFKTFVGMVPAVEAAIKIAEAWKADKPKGKIKIASGGTGGYTMPFEGMTACKTNYKLLRKEAAEHDAALPKCECCGEMLPDSKHCFGHEFSDGYPFCSEYCAEKDYEHCIEQDTTAVLTDGE